MVGECKQYCAVKGTFNPGLGKPWVNNVCEKELRYQGQQRICSVNKGLKKIFDTALKYKFVFTFHAALNFFLTYLFDSYSYKGTLILHTKYLIGL